MFEESLKYHKENHEYKKKMSESVKIMEAAERQLGTSSKAKQPPNVSLAKNENA